jgi:hypothetical protein
MLFNCSNRRQDSLEEQRALFSASLEQQVSMFKAKLPSPIPALPLSIVCHTTNPG